MILPLSGHHIADVGNNRCSYPSTVATYHLMRRNDLDFYTTSHLGPNVLSRCYENVLFRKHYKLEPARPLFFWKHSFIIEGINDDNQAV